jgi:hypothetical protein
MRREMWKKEVTMSPLAMLSRTTRRLLVVLAPGGDWPQQCLGAHGPWLGRVCLGVEKDTHPLRCSWNRRRKKRATPRDANVWLAVVPC